MSKSIFIIGLILFLLSCGDSVSENYTFKNEACRQAIEMGYPSEVCDCINSSLLELKNPMNVNNAYINELVENCVSKIMNLELGY